MPLFQFAWFVWVVPHSRSVLVLVKMTDSGDFLDALLSESLGAPPHSSPQNSGLFTEPSLTYSIANFDLSLLEPSSSSSPASFGDSTLFLPRRDSLQARVSEIEDRLGVFYVSVRGVRSSQVVESMTLACQAVFDPAISCDSFSVVRVLDSRNPGVLLRVASLELKHRILGCKDALKCRGLVVGLA